MATTFVEYTGDGNATKQFTFPSVQESDVKVRVDCVLKTTSTHYNITNYTTTGGGNVVFTSGNIPSSPANIRIYRDTNVDAPKATFTAGSSVKAADLNNNTTQLLYRAQEEQAPNLIHTYDIDAAAIETSNIKDANVTTAKLADSSVTEAKLAANSVTTPKILNRTITAEKIAGNSITTSELGNSCVEANELANNAVVTAKIQDSAVTTQKIADGAVTAAKIAGNSITTGQLANSSVDSNELANGAVVTAKIATGAVTSGQLAADSVITAKIQNDAVTTAKIAPDAVTNAKIANDSIDSEHYVDGSIDAQHLATDSVITAKIQNGAVSTAKIADDAVDSSKIADNAVVTSTINAQAVTTTRIANLAIDSSKLASNSVTVDKIADAELTTLSGMQSATASKLADSTALTADIADLNQIDGMAKETTITNDDTKFPTSGAVVDFVAAQLEPFGGFEAVATEVAFPNTQPVSGVVISIGDAGGVVVNGSGTSTTGRTVGGTTVTINNFPSSLHSKTMAAGIGLMVSSTGSGQIYNYHKILAKEADVEQLSNDINDFAARYRVGSSNPTSALDAGDLFFNTSTSKLLVYNATNTAWEEAQSIGNFFINTISSSSATGGGSATANGSAYRFTLSDAGAVAQQHIVSVDGVIQKPNSGSSQPSEGFAIDGSDIIFGSAPVNGASLFVITCGSTVNVGTPGNNTVSSSELQNGSVINSKLATDSVSTAKIQNGAITNSKIDAGAVTNASLGTNAVTSNKILDGTIVNVDINASAAIAGTKISPDFGSQAISTTNDSVTIGDSIIHSGDINTKIRFPSADTVTMETGGIEAFKVDSSGDFTLGRDYSGYSPGNNVPNSYILRGHSVNNSSAEAEYAKLFFKQSTVGGGSSAGIRAYRDGANYRTGLKFFTHQSQSSGGDGTERLKISHDGTVTIGGNLDVGSGVDVTGNITVTGTVDGVDIAALNTTVANLTTDLVSDTTPQLGGDLDTNGFDINFDANKYLTFGSISVGGQIYHTGSAFYIWNGTGTTNIHGDTVALNSKTGNEKMFRGYVNGAVELYHNNIKQLSTRSDGIEIHAPEGGEAMLYMTADEGDDDNDKYRFVAQNGGDLVFQRHNGTAYSSELRLKSAGGMQLNFQGNNKLETISTGCKIAGGDGDGLTIENGGTNLAAQFRLKNTTVNKQYRVGVAGNTGSFGQNSSLIFRDDTANVTRLELNTSGHLLPGQNNTYDLGSSTRRWRDIYTNDLNLSNEGSSNDVDGSWGDWTIQEGESDLFLKNNRSGKKYKFNLTEVS